MYIILHTLIEYIEVYSYALIIHIGLIFNYMHMISTRNTMDYTSTSRDFVVVIFLGLFEVPQSLVPILTDAVVKQISEQSGASITLRQDTRTMGQVQLTWQSGQTYMHMCACWHVNIYMYFHHHHHHHHHNHHHNHNSTLHHFIRIHNKGTETSRT